MTGLRRGAWVGAAALLIGMAVPQPAAAGKKDDTEQKPAPTGLRDVGMAFESARLLSGADKTAALEDVRGQLRAVRGLSDDDKAVAAALSAQIRYELQDYKGAVDDYKDASDKFGNKNPFQDDVDFASIRAQEM